jgi:phosphoribosylaminoimidazolecarboxamide formyltransferase/IMP cyclohydrolase
VFDYTTCVVVKHSNPCGVSEGKNLLDVYKQAFGADSLSAFGGVIALNKKCTVEIANEINKVFVEIVLAPSFDSNALEVFSNKKNLRILETGYIQKREDKLEVRNLDGGLLIQGVDTSEIKIEQLETVTDVSPDETDIENMLFGWRVLKHIKSNAILLVKNKTSVGIGGGQVSRVDAVDIAIKKSGERISL